MAQVIVGHASSRAIARYADDTLCYQQSRARIKTLGMCKCTVALGETGDDVLFNGCTVRARSQSLPQAAPRTVCARLYLNLSLPAAEKEGKAKRARCGRRGSWAEPPTSCLVHAQRTFCGLKLASQHQQHPAELSANGSTSNPQRGCLWTVAEPQPSQENAACVYEAPMDLWFLHFSMMMMPQVAVCAQHPACFTTSGPAQVLYCCVTLRRSPSRNV